MSFFRVLFRKRVQTFGVLRVRELFPHRQIDVNFVCVSGGKEDIYTFVVRKADSAKFEVSSQSRTVSGIFASF